jgi:hypothetical protein
MKVLTDIRLIDGEVHLVFPVEKLLELLPKPAPIPTLATIMDDYIKVNGLLPRITSRYTSVWRQGCRGKCLFYYYLVRDSILHMSIHDSLIDPLLPLDRMITKDTRFHATKRVSFTEEDDLREFLSLLSTTLGAALREKDN